MKHSKEFAVTPAESGRWKKLREYLSKSFVRRDGSTMTGFLDVDSKIRVTGNFTSTTGTGMELMYSGGSYIISYDRDLTAWKDLFLRANSIQIANNATNYTNFADDGTQTMVGTARVTKRLWINASALSAPTASAATLTTNSNGFIIYSFADNLTRYVRFNFQVPPDMDLSASSTICVGWSTPATSKNCRWSITYLITAPGDSTEQAGTNNVDVYASDASADCLVVSTVATIAGSTIASGDVCIHCILSRVGGDATDTLSDVAELHGVSFVYTANKLGT